MRRLDTALDLHHCIDELATRKLDFGFFQISGGFKGRFT